MALCLPASKGFDTAVMLYLKKMRMKLKLLTILMITAIGCNTKADRKTTKETSNVQVAGAMKNVMMKGELFGVIDLDTISNKTTLNGIGPMEYLSGEIMVLDGKSYVSTVVSDSTMSVKKTFKHKAPFFVYQNISEWEEINLSGSIQTIKELENRITNATTKIKQPFGFKIKGQIKNATIHIVNLPKGKKVSSPKQAHEGQINYLITDKNVTIIGFYSTAHKGVFTHHDTNVHMHLITEDKTKMGHLDAVNFKEGNIALNVLAE